MNGPLCQIFASWKHLFGERCRAGCVLFSIYFIPTCTNLICRKVVMLFLMENHSAVEWSFHAAATENVDACISWALGWARGLSL